MFTYQIINFPRLALLHDGRVTSSGFRAETLVFIFVFGDDAGQDEHGHAQHQDQVEEDEREENVSRLAPFEKQETLDQRMLEQFGCFEAAAFIQNVLDDTHLLTFVFG